MNYLQSLAIIEVKTFADGLEDQSEPVRIALQAIVGVMTLRVHKLATHLRADEAYTLIEFLGQLRGVLMAAYGDEFADMLREASQQGGDAQCEQRESDSELT